VSVMTADFWSTRMATRHDVARPTIYDPPHQTSEQTRYLPPLARTGTPTMNTTSQGTTRRCFIPRRSYQLSWPQPLRFQMALQSIFPSTSKRPGRHRGHRLGPCNARTVTMPASNRWSENYTTLPINSEEWLSRYTDHATTGFSGPFRRIAMASSEPRPRRGSYCHRPPGPCSSEPSSPQPHCGSSS
jgi:hypothetical protein